MNLPKISIITPSFNQGRFIEKTILSVLNQNYPNLEYIIIDGGSTDTSVEIIKKYESQLAYWVSEPDNGQSHALNKGFEKATGDILAYLNSDDWYEDNVFKYIAECFIKNKLHVLLGNCTILFQNPAIQSFVRKPINVSFESLLQYWKINFCPPQPSVFFSKELLDKVGIIDESLNYGMDLDLWLRMAQKSTFYYIDKNLSYYLIHDTSKSGFGDGFGNFVLEWKRVCRKYLRTSTLYQKLCFHKNYLLRNTSFTRFYT